MTPHSVNPDDDKKPNVLLEIAKFFELDVRILEGIAIFVAVIVGLILLAFICPSSWWSAWVWSGGFWISILVIIVIVLFFSIGKEHHGEWLIALLVVLFFVTVARKHPKDDGDNYILKKNTIVRIDIPEWKSMKVYPLDHKYYYIRFDGDSIWHPAGGNLPFVVHIGSNPKYFDLKQVDNESAAEVIVTVTFTKIDH
jgi:hypothetical protein